MIRFNVEIDTARPVGGIMDNEYGVGVRVSGNVKPAGVPEGEGATLIGILLAINGYMHSRGAPDFDCTKGLIDKAEIAAEDPPGDAFEERQIREREWHDDRRDDGAQVGSWSNWRNVTDRTDGK